MSFLGNPVLTGVTDRLSANEKRLVKTINLFSLLTIAGLGIGLINYLYMQYAYPAVMEITCFLLSVCVIGLNYLGKINMAVWLFLLNINIAIFFVCEFYDVSTGSYLFYFPLVLAVALLHIPGENLVKISLYYAITALFFFVSLTVDFDVIHSTANSAADNHYLFYYNVAISLVLSAIEIVMMINLINAQNKELVNILSNEKKLYGEATRNLQEKEVLLSELHHRVKNNMAIIASMLNLQIGSADNETLKAALRESRSRVMSMSLIHERLYRKKDLKHIEMDQYLGDLIRELLSGAAQTRIDIREEYDSVVLDISKAIPAGLIVNELITNSLKHAFIADVRNPRIEVSMKSYADKIHIIVRDNGTGFTINPNKPEEGGLGLTLVHSLTEQLDGSIAFSEKNGTEVFITFPELTLS